MALKDLYVIFQLIGLVILFFEFLYVCFQKPSKIQKFCIIIFISLILAFIAYIVELVATNQETAMIGCKLGYLGKPFALLALLYMLIEYSNIKVSRKIYIGVILYFMFLVIIVFTNYKNLYYTTVGFNLARVGSPLVVTRGFFWYVFMSSTLLLFAAYIGIIIYEYKNSISKQAKRMTLWLFLMCTCAIVGLLLFMFNLTNGYETTLLGIVLGSICFIILFTKYRIFDTLTLAKETALDDSTNGLIILDARENIKYSNKIAKVIVPQLNQRFTHRVEHAILKSIEESYKENSDFTFSNRVYRYHSNEIYSSKGILVGKKYMFDDVTEDHNYQARLEKDVLVATSKLRHIRDNILVSFANLVEARDGYTGVHVNNVSDYATSIAKKLKNNPKYAGIITDQFVRNIKTCSPLHDVGKIRIKDSILGKPGKLTAEEFDQMKYHTLYGAEIIETAMSSLEEPAALKICKEIAIGHHERYDGTGYPYGLAGDKIPLSARIVAVADVYDALRMKRPYKEPMSKEDSIKIIKEESGTHFDPEVVDAFLEVVDSFNIEYVSEQII